jgi:hypothetical protein
LPGSAKSLAGSLLRFLAFRSAMSILLWLTGLQRRKAREVLARLANPGGRYFGGVSFKTRVSSVAT